MESKPNDMKASGNEPEITMDMYYELLGEAYNLCAVANVYENVYFKEDPKMRKDIDSMRCVLDKFSMVLYGRTYAEASNNPGG